MAGYHLFTGNDQQRLVTALADVFQAHPLQQVFEPERIVVQSQGMKRWISLQLADRLGIMANCRYLFPNQLLGNIFECVVPEFREDDLFDREAISWKILDLLPAQLDRPGFKSLKHYLLENERLDPVKTWQLSRRIAYLFDQYCMYRPEMIGDWEAGSEDHWQADLWRTLRKGGVSVHLPDLRTAFFKRIHHRDFDPGVLPPRIAVFGITSLPPLHIDVLAALSDFRDVFLFFCNPTPAFWADIMSEKEVARQLQRRGETDLEADDLHMEVGNPLLASFGRTGRSYFALLQNASFHTVDEQELFSEPGRETLLGTLQADIYRLLSPSNKDYPIPDLPAGDNSVQIHSCHSRMREVEVLLDQLKWMLHRDPTLKPGDILVMAPDINPYAPMIRAVFSSPDSSGHHLPFSIADRTYRQESQVIQWFLRLLELPRSRFRLSEVLDLLESEAILSRFGIEEQETPLLRDWLTSANIRWGINGAHKASMGVPAEHLNSWEFGLNRILLGLAMPDDGGPPYQEILPFDRIEGSQGILLGKFLHFFSSLKSLVMADARQIEAGADAPPHLVDRPRTLSQWAVYLRELLQTFFAEREDWDEELQVLRNAIDQLETAALQTGITVSIEYEVIRDDLSGKMDRGGGGFGFLGSGITFCSMLPMRSIPFKTVALLGLNDQAFPRRNPLLSFDLIAAKPRPGDRSIREDDRYLFLEALLSARKTLYLSYVGQSIRDNSTIPPSIVLSELLQYLEAVGQRCGTDIPARMVQRHPLQAFNPRYFRAGSGLFSFSAENLEAARSLISGAQKSTPAFINRLPEPDDEWRIVGLDDLISFYSNPCRFLLRQRLGLFLSNAVDGVGDSESFALDALERYQLDQQLMDALLAGEASETLYERFQAAGSLSPPAAGRISFEKELETTERVIAALHPHIQETMREPAAFEIELGGFLVRGQIDGVFPQALVHCRMARLKCTDLVTSWLKWLLLNRVDELETPPFCLVAGLGKNRDHQKLRVDRIEDPEDHLIQLLNRYYEGLVRPLPYFPSTSEAYVRELLKTGHDRSKALEKAFTSWEGSRFSPGEREDPWFARCFSHCNPLDPEFMELSQSILEPILSRYQEIE